jgi:hypothetical protein
MSTLLQKLLIQPEVFCDEATKKYGIKIGQKITVYPAYDKIDKIFYNGMAKCKIDGKWGIINIENNLYTIQPKLNKINRWFSKKIDKGTITGIITESWEDAIIFAQTVSFPIILGFETLSFEATGILSNRSREAHNRAELEETLYNLVNQVYFFGYIYIGKLT